MDESSSIVFVLSCSDKIKCMQQFYRELLMNFKNLEKCDILKNVLKVYFSIKFQVFGVLKVS